MAGANTIGVGQAKFYNEMEGLAQSVENYGILALKQLVLELGVGTDVMKSISRKMTM